MTLVKMGATYFRVSVYLLLGLGFERLKSIRLLDAFFFTLSILHRDGVELISPWILSLNLT